MAGMEIETYGTECSEEFDYDDEVDYEEDGEFAEKIARLEKENEEMKEELKLGEDGKFAEKIARLEKENEEMKEELKKMAEIKEKLMEKLGEHGEWIENNARLEKENEEVKEKLKKKIAELKRELMEKLGERTETIARMTKKLARVNSGIALLSDLGHFPRLEDEIRRQCIEDEGIPRIDDETLKRLEDDTARKRSELGFLPRYDPPEKEEMFMRAMDCCILRKRQEIEAKKSGEMPADAPGLNMRREMAMFLV